MREEVSKAFHVSKYAEALKYKELNGGIMRRFVHPTMGVMYEIRHIPKEVHGQNRVVDDNARPDV